MNERQDGTDSCSQNQTSLSTITFSRANKSRGVFSNLCPTQSAFREVHILSVLYCYYCYCYVRISKAQSADLTDKQFGFVGQQLLDLYSTEAATTGKVSAKYVCTWINLALTCKYMSQSYGGRKQNQESQENVMKG